MKKLFILLTAITTIFLTAGYIDTTSASAVEYIPQVVCGADTTQCHIKSFSDLYNLNQIQPFMSKNGHYITNIKTNNNFNTFKVNRNTSISYILNLLQRKPFSEMALNSVWAKFLQTQNNASCAKLPFCIDNIKSQETPNAPVIKVPEQTTAEVKEEVTTQATTEVSEQTTTEVTTKVTTEATVTQAPPVIEVPKIEAPANDYASEVVRLVNIERAKYGLNSLTKAQNLNNAATVRAKEIVSSFSHTRPNGTSCFTVLKDLGISYNACGENIAAGQRTPAEVLNGWMNSEGHRANILNASFNKIGVGVLENSSSYGIYWAQIFTN